MFKLFDQLWWKVLMAALNCITITMSIVNNNSVVAVGATILLFYYAFSIIFHEEPS